jgi:hypothetical protein
LLVKLSPSSTSFLLGKPRPDPPSSLEEVTAKEEAATELEPATQNRLAIWMPIAVEQEAAIQNS